MKEELIGMTWVSETVEVIERWSGLLLVFLH